MSCSNVIFLDFNTLRRAPRTPPATTRAPELALCNPEPRPAERVLVLGLLALSAGLAPQLPPLLGWLVAL